MCPWLGDVGLDSNAHECRPWRLFHKLRRFGRGGLCAPLIFSHLEHALFLASFPPRRSANSSANTIEESQTLSAI